jgi:predicted P-loop ATPase
MNISLFKSGEKSHKSIGEMTIQDFLNKVKFGEWKGLIEAIREEENPEVQTALKRKLRGFTISGTFDIRGKSTLKTHSGFICMDFDKVQNLEDNIEKIKADPYTYALAKSASGKGFFAVVKINPNKHEECFNFLASYYYETYGLSVDRAPQNVASLRFASYDPNLCINDKSSKAKAKATPKRKPKKLSVVLTGDQVDQLIINAMHEGANVCESYDEWLKVGFALSELGETGRPHYHTLSSVYSEYNQIECDKQYDRCLNATGTGITMATLYWMLQQQGVTMPKDDKESISYALAFKGRGAEPKEIEENLVELKGKTKEEAKAIVDAIKDAKTLDLSDIADSPAKLNIALKQWILANYPIKLNDVTQMFEYEGQPLTDPKLKSIIYNAQVDFDTPSLTPKLVSDLVTSNEMPKYNPFKEFYEKHKDMKTNNELSRICDVITAKDDITKNIYIRKWFLGMIASIHGYPVRYVLSLVGKGLTGKTTFVRKLLPNDLEMYAGESQLDRGKDDELLMCQKLVILIDEFSGDMANDSKRFKSLTSKKNFDLRAPYARTNQIFKRLAIIAITSNQVDLMEDHTGNTRLLPVEVVTAIDFDLLHSLDKTALFVEAWREFEENELDRPWELTESEHHYLMGQSKEYEVANVEAELLNKYFRSPTRDEVEREVYELYTISEAKLFCESRAGSRPLKLTRFSHAMRELDMELKSYKKRRIGDRTPTMCYMLMKNENEYKQVEFK